MRENRPSGLEGGVAGNGHPYPYNTDKMRRVASAGHRRA